MKKVFLALGLGAVLSGSVAACNSTTILPVTPGLRRSGEASFLCLGPDGKGASLVDCPRARPLTRGGQIVGHEGYELHALVTQTATGEVGVVRLTGQDENGVTTARVLDVERSIPGPTPLRVGQRPVDIVTTPGGYASFVTVAELKKPGIFGLPTSCIFAPKEREDGSLEEQRDLTTWPACSLPSAPGNLLLVRDRADGDGRIRTSCGGQYVPADELPTPAAKDRLECPVDLSDEDSEPGRQKLLVALPEEGKLVVIDAQELLDRDPGTFDACKIEAELELSNALPGTLEQDLPLGLREIDGPSKKSYTLSGSVTAIPAGLAISNDLLVVGDKGSPLVHRVAVRDPCDLRELDPLVATSFMEPERLVTTSRVAITPETSLGNRYVYAVDEKGSRANDLAEASSSLIVFDISSGSASRLPMLKDDAELVPQEAPDRLAFAAEVKDIAFASLDEPEVDEVTGAGYFGVKCDPDPSLPSGDAGILYRNSDDYVSGASTQQFRGIFGYALLGNGTVNLIDVEDLDQACRRATRVNRSAKYDRYGCRGDRYSTDYLTDDGTASGDPTSTAEQSCRVVLPNRQRSGVLVRSPGSSTTVSYVRSATPSLSSYPRLFRDSRALPISRRTDEGRKKPIMVGVDYATPSGGTEPTDLYIGSTLRSQDGSQDTLLDIHPDTAEQASVSLPMVEPRSYPPTETVSATFEGDIDGLHRTGQFVFDGSALYLEDVDAFFCSGGVMGQSQMLDYGRTRFSLSARDAITFSERHGDYVQLISPLLPEDSDYWQSPPSECKALAESLFDECDATFGKGNILDTKASRDFRVLRAFQNHLELEPRTRFDGLESLVPCCFPEVTNYRVRAGNHWVVRGSSSGFRHQVRVGATRGDYGDFACEADPSPLRSREAGRAFEITATVCETPGTSATSSCVAGQASEDDVVCVIDPSEAPLTPSSPHATCIFEGLTRRFAIYRGIEPSVRGMAFTYDFTGGFAVQSINIAASTTSSSSSAAPPAVLPVSLSPIPTFSMLAVIDSQARGITLIDMRSATLGSVFN